MFWSVLAPLAGPANSRVEAAPLTAGLVTVAARVDHDVDSDRRLLRLDELREPEIVPLEIDEQMHGRIRDARARDELPGAGWSVWGAL